jgi:hypothetical protein
MKRIIFATLVLTVWLLSGCQKDQLPETQQAQSIPTTQYFTPVNIGEISTRGSCDWTELPAGSVDALAAAIANTCDNGVIYLKSGLHTETKHITITKPVKIIGENGAVLKIKSDLAPTNPVTGAIAILPGLHVLNAPGTLIQDLEIRPVDDDGGSAILFENSDASATMRCKISNFQFAVVVEKCDRMTIMFNKIATTSAWQTGVVAEAHAIMLVNGASSYVSDNEVSNSFFGIWACGEWGTLERNFCHGNAVGLILCNVPKGVILPSGEVTGSEIPATGWKTTNNTYTGNFDNGIMIIDGSKFNQVWNNQVHGNGLSPITGTAADIETYNDSYLFGFLTPKVRDNYIDTSSDPATTIRNCGTNNTFVGGIPIGGDCR